MTAESELRFDPSRRRFLKSLLGLAVSAGVTKWAWDDVYNPPDNATERKLSQIYEEQQTLRDGLYASKSVVERGVLWSNPEVLNPEDPRLKELYALERERISLGEQKLAQEGNILRVRRIAKFLGPLAFFSFLPDVVGFAGWRLRNIRKASAQSAT